MVETSPTCCECGKPVHPNDPGVALVGFVPTGEIYRHAGACSEAANDRAVNAVQCRGCHRTFDVRTGIPGRPREYHSEACRRSHEARVNSLWRDAAKGRLPEGLDALQQRRHELGALVDDLQAGRFNGQTKVADRVLRDYAHQLAGAIREAEVALRLENDRRVIDRRQRWADGRRQAAEAEHAAFEASIK